MFKNMTNLRDFLEAHRIKGKAQRNFVCLQKSTGMYRMGNFFIPENKQDDLWALYSRAAPDFTENDCPTLVYRPPERSVQPLQIDCVYASSEKQMYRLIYIADLRKS